MMKDRVARVVSNAAVAANIYQMVLQCDELPPIKSGQFVQIKVPDDAHILRRPFCIADYDVQNKTITLIYQVKGGGTERLSAVSVGETLQVLFPLGNGFTIDPAQKKVMLVGGGMGSAIFPAVMREYPDKQFYPYFGFSKAENIICADLSERSEKMVITTDDGSNGTRGFVTELIARDLAEIKPDVVLCCGPEPMYNALKKTFAEYKKPVYVSLEGRMGCGFGACMICACKIKKAGNEYTLRVCKDGPVFDLYEVVT